MKWVNAVSAALATIFVALICYGAYNWYFRKPQPVIQNTYQNTTVMPGANQTIENYKQEELKQKLNAITVGVNPNDVKDWFVGYSRSF